MIEVFGKPDDRAERVRRNLRQARRLRGNAGDLAEMIFGSSLEYAERQFVAAYLCNMCIIQEI